MSLSDLFCVERHKDQFVHLVKNKLDIVFANEQEILALLNSASFSDVVSFCKDLDKEIIITRGKNGAIAIKNNETFECSAMENIEITDLTGAGDLFAAGYLHGVINNMTVEQSLKKGTELSSKIIQKIGARI